MARIDFADWLKDQLDAKGWKAAELARRSGVAQSYLSRIIKRERNIGHEVAEAIAGPLGLPPIEVKIAAGLEKPAPDGDTPSAREILDYFTSLSAQHQQDVIEHAKALYALERASTPYKVN